MKKIFLYVSMVFLFLFAEVPNSISFQGYLTNVDGEPLTTGGYYLEFSIYDSETDGIVYWSESNWEFIEDNGLISSVLGSDDNPLIIPEDGVAYLGISIQNEPLGNRFKISSVPYSMQSGLADTANYSFVSENSFHSELSDNATMLGGNTANYYLPITVHGHVDAVTCQPSNWTTLIEVDITIPDSMYIYSFGTVSGAGWYDSHKMLQISIYDESYSNFYSYTNVWGDVANAVHFLPAGTYHIQFYGSNNGDSAQDMSNITLYAIALNHSQNNTVRTGPFPPPENAELPNPSEILNH